MLFLTKEKPFLDGFVDIKLFPFLFSITIDGDSTIETRLSASIEE